MKKMKFILVVALLIAMSTSVSAQGFLKKAADAVSSATGKVTEKIGDVMNPPKMDWDKIPVYTAQVINETENGNPVLNEDGTPKYRVLLVDQFGNYRSVETVKAQKESINKSIVAILAKVGGGAALGAVTGVLSGGGSGAAIGAGSGAATGVLASIDDIKNAKKQKKSLKQQDKLLAAYESNFTSEGIPVDAKVDLTKIKDLNINLDNATSKSTAEVKAELENENFTNSDEFWVIPVEPLEK